MLRGDKVKTKKPALGTEVGLVSQRNRTHEDKKKKASKEKCRKDKIDENNA